MRLDVAHADVGLRGQHELPGLQLLGQPIPRIPLYAEVDYPCAANETDVVAPDVLHDFDLALIHG